MTREQAKELVRTYCPGHINTVWYHRLNLTHGCTSWMVFDSIPSPLEAAATLSLLSVGVAPDNWEVSTKYKYDASTNNYQRFCK